MKMKIITSSYQNYFQEQEMMKKDGVSTIVVQEKKRYQMMMGFGGAFTDSACGIFQHLSKEEKKTVLDALFSSDGLSYTLGRLTIGPCDFSRYPYHYIKENDATFSLDHEEKCTDIFVKRAMKYQDLTLLASPWTPPAFWKDSKDACHGGKLKEDCYEAYAEYLANYVEAQQKRGMPLRYITMQNEPEAVQSWESCIFNEEEELRLVKLFVKKCEERKLPISVLLWDHNRDVIVRRAENYQKADPKFTQYVKGFAYHWYDGDKWDQLALLHEKYPSMQLMFTEGCIELLSLDPKNPSSAIGTMKNALRYARNYIEDSLRGTSAFIDWNLLLDEKGGPNHVGNYCEALIQYHEKEHRLMFNPSYYVVKHFAHFVKPGAVRIGISFPKEVPSTAFQNKDGSIVIVILNEGNERKEIVEMKGEKVEITLPSQSVATIVC